jgi:hypothetical protein
MNVVQKSSTQGVSFDKVVHSVYETNDFSIFKRLDGNRVISLEHVRWLTASIEKNGMLCKPILVNEKMEVIDGQHLLAAAEIAETCIYYVISEKIGLDEVRILNSNQQNWTKKDHMGGSLDLALPSYLKLENFTKANPEFNFKDCINLCSNSTGMEDYKSSKRRGNEHAQLDTKAQVFDEGTWTGKDFELAQEWASKIKLVYPYFNGCFKRAFVGSMIDLFNNSLFNFDQFMNKVQLFPSGLADRPSKEQMKFQIEGIYNYRSSEYINLRS